MKSIETNLERIANALETLVTMAPPMLATSAVNNAATEAPPAAPSGVAATREDVHAALTEFVTEGPGKAAAKEVLGEFKAGSIATLEVGDYAPFIARLAEVTRLAA